LGEAGELGMLARFAACLPWLPAFSVGSTAFGCDRHKTSCHGKTVAAKPIGGEKVLRHYELMVILDPSLEERTVAPSLDQYLNVIRTAGGSVEKLDVWGRRRLSFEINKKAEGIYAVVDLQATPEAVAELDRQLRLNESILRTKVIRPETR
jgi:small subunit ribosomal protein S6